MHCICHKVTTSYAGNTLKGAGLTQKIDFLYEFSLGGGANCANRLQQIPLGVGTLMRASVTMFCSRWCFLSQGRVRSVSFKVDPTDFCSALVVEGGLGFGLGPGPENSSATFRRGSAF